MLEGGLEQQACEYELLLCGGAGPDKAPIQGHPRALGYRHYIVRRGVQRHLRHEPVKVDLVARCILETAPEQHSR